MRSISKVFASHVTRPIDNDDGRKSEANHEHKDGDAMFTNKSLTRTGQGRLLERTAIFSADNPACIFPARKSSRTSISVDIYLRSIANDAIIDALNPSASAGRRSRQVSGLKCPPADVEACTFSKVVRRRRTTDFCRRSWCVRCESSQSSKGESCVCF